MKSLLRLPALLPLILIAGFFTGCMTRDPDTGQPVYDEEATAAIVAAFRGAVAQGTFDAVQEEPDLREYLTHVDMAICEMRDSGEFSPDAIIARLDSIAKEHGVLGDPWVFTAKNVLMTVYRVNYARRFRVSMDPEKWPYHLMTVMCEGIRDGLNATSPPATSPDPEPVPETT